MSNNLSIRQFNIREANWALDGKVLSNIRRLVFIVEQDVPQDEEWDGKDEESWHWLATDDDDAAIGTARLLPDGKIGRMAVLEKFRGSGVGAALLERAVGKARHLGFKEVSLNAQIHALPFYERAGFVASGDEFEEAGIAHQKMSQRLGPLDDNIQRYNFSDSASALAIKQFDTREVEFEELKEIIRNLRKIVFVTELGLPESFIGDEFEVPNSSIDSTADSNAVHWIAEDPSGVVIGCIRISMDGQISRLAVMPLNRRQGIGHSLLELAATKAIRLGLPEVRSDAPASLDGFYAGAGFTKRGESFDEFGLEQQTYFKVINSEGVHQRSERAVDNNVNYTDAGITYQLGEDNNLIMLRREEDFKNVILEMTSQASQSIRIYSPLLEHKLFDNMELLEICSALARKNRYTSIEILLYEAHRAVKHGHALLEISRKLPSSIKMKIVHPDYRRLNHEYVLADTAGVVYRLDHEEFEGYANFSDKTECGRMGRQFQAAWESGLNDPDLRQLRI